MIANGLGSSSSSNGSGSEQKNDLYFSILFQSAIRSSFEAHAYVKFAEFQISRAGRPRDDDNHVPIVMQNFGLETLFSA